MFPSKFVCSTWYLGRIHWSDAAFNVSAQSRQFAAKAVATLPWPSRRDEVSSTKCDTHNFFIFRKFFCHFWFWRRFRIPVAFNAKRPEPQTWVQAPSQKELLKAVNTLNTTSFAAVLGTQLRCEKRYATVTILSTCK